MIIDDIWGGGAENARDFASASHETSQAQSRITGRIFLIISAFVGFVDDDQA